MLWVIVGVVVLGAVFVLGTLLGSSLSRSLAGDRARRRDLGGTPVGGVGAGLGGEPFEPRGARTTRPARTLFDG